MKYLFLIFFASLFIACNNHVESEIKEVDALRASCVYRGDSVYSYMEKHKDENKAIAESFISKGLNEKESNPEKSVYYLKRAVTLNPTLNNYLELAKELNITKDYTELSSLYYFLTQESYLHSKDTSIYLFGPPNEDIFYEYIAANFLSNKHLYAEDIYLAKDLKMNIDKLKQRFLSDSRLKIDTTSVEGKYTMLQFLPYDELQKYSKKSGVFTDFLASIDDSSFVFDIDEKKVQQFNYEKFNGMGMNDGEMQRDFESVYMFYLKEKRDNKDKWFVYNFHHVLRLSNTFTAVVYAIDSSQDGCPKEMRHIYHNLVIYDNEGNIIDSKIVALQAGEQLETLHFNNFKFSITRYKRIWKKVYDMKDFDNYITDTKKINESFYEIMPDGT